MLLSKVKIFNLRFKAKFYGTATQGSLSQPEEMDPRDTPAFKALDGALSAFKIGFPRQYEDPIPNGVVDSHLYVAHLAPHMYVPRSWNAPGADRLQRDTPAPRPSRQRELPRPFVGEAHSGCARRARAGVRDMLDELRHHTPRSRRRGTSVRPTWPNGAHRRRRRRSGG